MNLIKSVNISISFQSGNDEILKQMSRGYSIKKYKNIIENIRSLMPDASITADAIVAFPGETEQQYQDTLKLISEIGFDQVNTAAYSQDQIRLLQFGRINFRKR